MFESNIEQKTIKLLYTESAPDVWNELSKLERSGWVKRDVENPETVAQHTVSLMELAKSIEDRLEDEDLDDLLRMLEVHDWPESKTGDEIVVERDTEKRKELKKNKLERERSVMIEICSSVQDLGDEILSLWERFETSEDPTATLARQLDKYQAVEKALVYEFEQGIKCFNEFYEYALLQIDHPLVLEMMESQKRKWLENK